MDVSQYDSIEHYGDWFNVTHHKTVELNNTVAHVAADNRAGLGIQFVWREDADTVVVFMVGDQIHQHEQYDKDTFSVHDEEKRNKTDYDLPQHWRHMTPEEKSNWMTHDRAANQAANQDTPWGRGFEQRREEAERTSSEQYRVDDDETFK